MKKLILLTLLVLCIVSQVHAAPPFTSIQLRRDTPANWVTYNPVLAAGETGCEMTGSPLRCTAQKVGDGVTAWSGLPYTNQVSRSVQGDYSGVTLKADDVISKGPVIDVRHPAFAGGAKWDNSTDDSEAITAAVAAAMAAGGGIVMLPKGTGISGPISLPSNVYLRGQGRYLTTIKLKAGSNDSLVKVNEQSYWGILDLTLDGNKANQSGTSYGLWVHTVTTHDPTPYVSNVFVQNCHSDGIHIDEGSQGGGYYSNVDAYSNVTASGTVTAAALTATTGGSANHAICWKADGKTLGYCSAVVASDGTCGTCN